MVEDVHRRLAELGTRERRAQGPRRRAPGRMDGAESRFSQLAAQAEEAQRVSDTMPP